MSDTATIAKLRHMLNDDFPSFDMVARRMREAGLIDAGTSGRDGVGSAPLDYRQAVLLLLALAEPCEPIDAPAEAQRLAAFKLLRLDEVQPGAEVKRSAFQNQTITLLDTLALELERFDADREPSGYAISAAGCCQIAPARLVFGQSLEDVVSPADWECTGRVTCLSARLIGDVAALFHSASAKAA